MKSFLQLGSVVLVSSLLLLTGSVMITYTFIHELGKITLVVIESYIDDYMEKHLWEYLKTQHTIRKSELQ